VFAATGGYESPEAFTDGVAAALPVAVVVLAIGAVLALFVPPRMGAEPEAAEGQARRRSPEPRPAVAQA
jgi:hypothetical protein